MTKLFIQAVPILVELVDAQPSVFVWNKQKHKVQEINYRWRLNAEWWKSPTWRDYYELTTDRGMLVLVYNDLINDNWFLQLLYD